MGGGGTGSKINFLFSDQVRTMVAHLRIGLRALHIKREPRTAKTTVLALHFTMASVLEDSLRFISM